MNASREPVAPRSDAERRARIDLAACHRLAARFGFNEGIDNHLTMLIPGYSDRFYLAPFGLLWSEVKASDLLELNFSGTVVAGHGLVEDTALYIHLSVHRLLPQARCVLHTHMPYATALSMLEDPRLEMAGQNALGFHGDIAYVDYNGLALDYDEGERVRHRFWRCQADASCISCPTPSCRRPLPSSRRVTASAARSALRCTFRL
jgi:ribulose-5-phosphate 4-epimerase/fuculose-1-phosphate aldolase